MKLSLSILSTKLTHLLASSPPGGRFGMLSDANVRITWTKSGTPSSPCFLMISVGKQNYFLLDPFIRPYKRASNIDRKKKPICIRMYSREKLWLKPPILIMFRMRKNRTGLCRLCRCVCAYTLNIMFFSHTQHLQYCMSLHHGGEIPLLWLFLRILHFLEGVFPHVNQESNDKGSCIDWKALWGEFAASTNKNTLTSLDFAFW